MDITEIITLGKKFSNSDAFADCLINPDILKLSISRLSLRWQWSRQRVVNYKQIIHEYANKNGRINICKTIKSNIETSTNNDKNISTKKNTFNPPTFDEIKQYKLERNSPVNAVTFLSYYTSNGWKVGKNKMVDWKSAFISWEEKLKNQSNDRTEKNRRNSQGATEKELAEIYARNYADDFSEEFRS